MGRHIPEEVRVEAVRLRQEERLGRKEIASRCSISSATVAKLLKDWPLTDEEREHRQRYGSGKKKGRALKEISPSPLYSKLGQREYNNNEKGRIAETAVLLRLLLLQHDVYGAVVGNNHIDWIVSLKDSEKLVKIQVRWAGWSKFGAPAARTTCSAGRKKQKPLDRHHMDIFVMYDLVTDTAYVLLPSEIEHVHRLISARDDAAERWDKLEGS